MGKDKGKSEDEKLNEEPEITEIDEVFEDAATSRFGAGFLRWIITFAVAAAFAAIAFLTQQPAWGIVGVLGAAVFFSCMHVVLEWERTVVLRFGKFNRVAGPGLIFMIPFVEYSAATVDLRMRSTAFKAEHVLASDLVPVDVDAVLFWMVWDAGKACSEIRNYERLVYWVAQTTLRDVMGGVGIAQMGARRTQIDKEVASILERKTSEWGITIVSVEMARHRDPRRPAGKLALSAEARAEDASTMPASFSPRWRRKSRKCSWMPHARTRRKTPHCSCEPCASRQTARKVEGRSGSGSQRAVRSLRGIGKDRERVGPSRM